MIALISYIHLITAVSIQYIYLADSYTTTQLPKTITLHTTAKPGKAKMPPHLKNQDTVVLNLNGVGPTDIPDGYEPIPLDKLTSDHEVGSHFSTERCDWTASTMN